MEKELQGLKEGPKEKIYLNTLIHSEQHSKNFKNSENFRP